MIQENESKDLGPVWIATKAYLTNFLVMTKRLVLVWILANFLACQCSTIKSSSFFVANVGQLVGKEWLNQNIG
jgi:hypothetical protein